MPPVRQVLLAGAQAYEKRLADAPVGGQPVRSGLAVRRFFCGNPGRMAVTFAEQVQG